VVVTGGGVALFAFRSKVRRVYLTSRGAKDKGPGYFNRTAGLLLINASQFVS